MKILVASDIHGYHAAARAVIEKFVAERCDRLFLLGDLLSGRFGAEVDRGATAQLLCLLGDKIAAVRGNCDSYFDENLLSFALPAFLEREVAFTKKTRRILLTHGHRTIAPDKIRSAELVLEGHTHIPVLTETDGRIFLNPGSCACPRGGSAPCFGLLDEDRLTIQTLSGETVASLCW